MSMSEINSHPLSWPMGWSRTNRDKKKRSNFNSRKETGASYRFKRPLTISEGIQRVLDELHKMDIPNYQVIISTNMPVKANGLPYSGRKEPDDCGAAVYWRPYGSPEGTPHKVMAIDQYDRLADNLAAIAGTLGALRAVERWGGAAILDRAFQGFQALPERVSRAWFSVLGVKEDALHEDVELSYKKLRSKHHPDKGGDTDAFQAVQEAWQQYRDERRVF